MLFPCVVLFRSSSSGFRVCVVSASQQEALSVGSGESSLVTFWLSPATEGQVAPKSKFKEL